MTRLYVGPAGALTEVQIELGNPLTVETPAVAATHTGLTGATSRDVLGFGRSWAASFEWLTPSEVARFQAWSLGAVGPLWLVEDGPEANLLPLVAPRPLLPGAVPSSTLTPSGLDRLWSLPASSSLRTPVVPAVAGRAVRVDLEASGSVTAYLEALNTARAVVATSAPAPAGASVAHLTVQSSDLGLTTDPAFWRVRFETGTGASPFVGDLAVVFGGDRRAYSAPGASARVTVETSTGRAHWIESTGSVTFRKV